MLPGPSLVFVSCEVTTPVLSREALQWSIGKSPVQHPGVSRGTEASLTVRGDARLFGASVLPPTPHPMVEPAHREKAVCSGVVGPVLGSRGLACSGPCFPQPSSVVHLRNPRFLHKWMISD